MSVISTSQYPFSFLSLHYNHHLLRITFFELVDFVHFQLLTLVSSVLSSRTMGHFSLARLVAVIGALSVRPGTASPVAEPYGHAYGHGYGDGYGYGSVTSQTDAAATTTSTLAYYGYQANSDDPASSTASDNCTSSSIISDAAPTSLTTYPAEYGYGDPSASTSAALNYTNNSPSAYLPYTAPNVYTTTIYSM